MRIQKVSLTFLDRDLLGKGGMKVPSLPIPNPSIPAKGETSPRQLSTRIILLTISWMSTFSALSSKTATRFMVAMTDVYWPCA